ncbi:hypothetical protein [Aquincola tertiaricarbonis]|uniref:hypothetical protein n=1 Tax=Aquincola tertiaricarbonis TaxID=391953 RepID=UPI0006150F47|nr:hypothetical protein [Aquincola tertiaricarbonis]
MNPYRDALAWISQNPDAASAIGLAKLILSLANRSPFSLGECLATLSGPQVRLAMRVANHYAERGDDNELQAVSTEVCSLHPRLVVLGEIMTEAGRREDWLHRPAGEVHLQFGKKPGDKQ